jgi:hypothetical protein
LGNKILPKLFLTRDLEDEKDFQSKKKKKMRRTMFMTKCLSKTLIHCCEQNEAAGLTKKRERVCVERGGIYSILADSVPLASKKRSF